MFEHHHIKSALLAGAKMAIGSLVRDLLVRPLKAFMSYLLTAAAISFAHVAFADLMPQLQKDVGPMRPARCIFGFAGYLPLAMTMRFEAYGRDSTVRFGVAVSQSLLLLSAQPRMRTGEPIVLKLTLALLARHIRRWTGLQRKPTVTTVRLLEVRRVNG